MAPAGPWHENFPVDEEVWLKFRVFRANSPPNESLPPGRCTNVPAAGG